MYRLRIGPPGKRSFVHLIGKVRGRWRFKQCTVMYSTPPRFGLQSIYAEDDPLAAADKPAYLGRAAGAKFAFTFW